MKKITATSIPTGSVLEISDKHGNAFKARLGDVETAALIFDLIKCLPDGHVLRRQYNL